MVSVNKNWLLGRGWTKTMIARFLGAPDRAIQLRSNLEHGLPEDRPECRPGRL